MSRAAVKAKQKVKKAADRWYRDLQTMMRWEIAAQIDTLVVKCCGCGTVQVTKPEMPCFVCDSDTATFVCHPWEWK